MATVVCTSQQTGGVIKPPYVVFGFTTLDPATLALTGTLDGKATINSTRTVWIGQCWFIWFNLVDPSHLNKRYRLLIKNAGATVARVKKVKPLSVLYAGVSVTSPADGSTAHSHIALTATGTVIAPQLLAEAKLEYLEDEVTFTGQIIKDDSPWIAAFSCPGQAGVKQVTLTAKDNAGPPNVDETTFTLTDPPVPNPGPGNVIPGP